MKLDYVLGLKIEDFLERRLETQVCHRKLNRNLVWFTSKNVLIYIASAGIQIRTGEIDSPCSCLDKTETYKVRITSETWTVASLGQRKVALYRQYSNQRRQSKFLVNLKEVIVFRLDSWWRYNLITRRYDNAFARNVRCNFWVLRFSKTIAQCRRSQLQILKNECGRI